MPRNKVAEEPTHPSWWDEPTDKEQRLVYGEGVVDYLDWHNESADQQKFALKLVKNIIPHVARLDKRWKEFPKELFDQDTYDAHNKLYHCIRNKLESLAKETQTKAKKKALLEKAAKDKEDEDDSQLGDPKSDDEGTRTPAKQDTQIISK